MLLFLGGSVFAQNNIIAGINSPALKEFPFDPFQHPGLMLLSESDKVYSFQSKAYKTHEKELTQKSFKTIVSVFSSLRQAPIGESVFMKENEIQITFLLINDTQSTQWVLDLSPSLFLPSPAYKDVVLYNSLTGQKITTFKPTQTKHIVTLEKNKPYMLTLSFQELESRVGSRWGNYAPKLYMYGSLPDRHMPIAHTVLISLGVSLFLISLVFLFNIPFSISLPACIGWALFVTSILLNSSFIHLGLAHITPLLFILWLPFIVVAQRGLLYKRQAASLVFILNFGSLLLSVGLVLFSGLYAFGILQNSMPLFILSTLVLLCAVSFLSSLFLTMSKISRATLIPFLGWFCLFMGALITALSFMEILPPLLFSANAYYGSTLFFGLCWVIGLAEELKTEKPEEKINKKEVKERGGQLQKLKEVREGFDNERLVKVLKRERQIMKELREKDVQLTEDMKVEKEKADYANQAKSVFLAVISHEIRTPMTGIMGMVRLLRHSALNAEQNDHVDTISDSGDAMMALLNDILDYEKIDTGKMDLESIEFDLYNLLKNVQSLMLGRTEEYNIDLKLEIDKDTPQYIYGDPTRLRQILLNLVSNALKFTKEGYVSLQVHPLEHKNAHYQLYFSVQDTGIGIPKEAQVNLFNPFIQADSATSRKYGGSGLGLAICQKLVNTMGGDINVNSTSNEGSNFFFSIMMPEGKMNDPNVQIPPVFCENSQPIHPVQLLPPKEEMHPSSETLTIMVVDDNAINQKVVAGLISPLGHQTYSFVTGQEAIDDLKTNNTPYDLIFMDIEMPGISGIETTRVIREDLKIDKESLPIIALTGNTGQDEIASYLEVGMNGFIAKPIEAEKLEKILHKIKEKEAIDPLSMPPLSSPLPQKEPVQQERGKSDLDNPLSKELELSLDQESSLELDDDYESPISPSSSSRGSQDLSDTPHGISLSDMDTGLIIDELAEEDKKKEEEYSYNPADFDPSTLMSLKTSMVRHELTSMIHEFTLKIDNLFYEISNALQNQKLDLVRARLHDLKGMAGNFGLVGLSSRATLMEDTIKTSNPPQATLNSLRDQLEEDIKQAHLFLEKWK